MKTRLSVFFLVIVLILGLSSCKKSEPTPAPETNPGVTATYDPNGDFAYVLGKNSFLVGYTVYEPMNYTDDAGNFTGFDTELTKLVSNKLGLNPVFIEIDWSTKEIELAAKSIDCIWNGMTITEERKKNVDFTVPYLMNAQVLVMKSDFEYAGFESLFGKTVVAEAGSAGETTIEEYGGFADAVYIAKEKQTDCLMEVAAGTADVAVLDLTLANAMIGPGTNYANLVIKDSVAEEFYAVAFRLGSDITEMVDNAFAELINDGTMVALAKKYDLVLAK